MILYIIAGIILIIAAIALGKIARCNLQPSEKDWTDGVFRPCCRHCAYWTELAENGDGFCEKKADYVSWDYCCIDYDGIDTEVRDYGVDCNDV